MADFDELGDNQALAYRLVNHMKSPPRLLNHVRCSRNGNRSGFRIRIDPIRIKPQRLNFFGQLFHIRHMMDGKSCRLAHQFRSADNNGIRIGHPVEIKTSRKVIHCLFASHAMKRNKYIAF